jgi:hypothetical protein
MCRADASNEKRRGEKRREQRGQERRREDRSEVMMEKHLCQCLYYFGLSV